MVAAGYLAGSVGLQHRMVGELATVTAGSVPADSALFAWWLRWLPFAIEHGLNPLYSDFMHYPTGVNGMWNSTMPVLAAVLAPVTLTAGPVAAYNVGMLAGPVVSGLVLVWALAPYVHSWPGRILAGGLYAFSPFVIAHEWAGHLNLVWPILPPILLRAVHELVVREQRRPWLAGGLLGVAFAVQTGLYTQTVALGAIALAVTALVLVVRWPGMVRARVRQVALAGVSCVGVWVVLCAYPLWLLLAGPGRPGASIRESGYYVTDLVNVAVPTELTAWPAGTRALAGQMRGYPGEQGAYLGVALLVLIVAAVLLVRRPVVRVTASVAAVLLVLSFGPSLVVLGRDTGIPGPWALLSEAPLVHHAEPVRLQVFVGMCAAMVVALWIDQARRWPVPGRLVGLVLAAVAVVAWVPADRMQTRPVIVPAVFTAGDSPIRDGDVVETWPRISGLWETGGIPMLWQAASGMGYRTTGGYFIGSDSAHPVLLEAPSSTFQAVAGELATGGRVPVEQAPVAAAELAARGVTAVVVVGGPPALLDWARAVTSTNGIQYGQAWVFRVR